MSATLTTMNSVLKEAYASDVIDQLNQEINILEQFEKSTAPWGGKQLIIPVHVSRNSGVGYAAESGALPAAGEQGWLNLTVTAKYIFGRIAVTQQTISATKKGGMVAFVSALESEIKGVKVDLKKVLNNDFISGGRVVGYFNEKKLGAAPDDWQFSGDTAKVTAAIAAKGGPIACQFIRMDTYAVVDTDNVSAVVTEAAKGVMAELTVDTALDTRVATIALPVGIPVAVRISDTDPSLAYLDQEVTGVFTNLSSATHFGLDRTSATGTGEELQSNVFTMALVTTDAADGLELTNIQEALDTVLDVADSEPDQIWFNPRQRASYASLLQQTASLQTATDGARKGDGGFSSLSYGDIPMMHSSAVSRSMLVFLDTSSWEVAELDPMQFMEEDGNMLSRLSGTAGYEAVLFSFMDLVCVKPKANAILCGILP